MSRSDSYGWIVPVGLVGLGWYVVHSLFGDEDHDPENGQGGHVTPHAEDTRPATFTESEALAYADTIFQALRFFGEDETLVVRTMQRAQVEADVRMLVNAYGSRALNFGYLNRLTLPQAIAAYLSDGDREDINADYQGKGISIRF